MMQLVLYKEIYPYLVIESNKKGFKLIIEKYKTLTPRNGRYTDEMIKSKEEFYNKFMSIK